MANPWDFVNWNLMCYTIVGEGEPEVDPVRIQDDNVHKIAINGTQEGFITVFDARSSEVVDIEIDEIGNAYFVMYASYCIFRNRVDIIVYHQSGFNDTSIIYTPYQTEADGMLYKFKSYDGITWEQMGSPQTVWMASDGSEVEARNPTTGNISLPCRILPYRILTGTKKTWLQS